MLYAWRKQNGALGSAPQMSIGLPIFLGNQSTQERPSKLDEPDDSEIRRVMAALGRRGGKISGERRMVDLTQEQRSQIAFKAAQARWSNQARKP